jgi:hypothetical protein
MIFQPFAARRNQSYLDLWAVIGDLWYPGYKTLTPIFSYQFKLLGELVDL